MNNGDAVPVLEYRTQDYTRMQVDDKIKKFFDNIRAIEIAKKRVDRLIEIGEL
jgi:hypothetical protein